MSDIPSPILIFGDHYISKNNVISAKKKYPQSRWITKSASTESLDEIQSEACLYSWDDSEKIMLIQDLPNKKNVREFLLDLSKNVPSNTKIIIWDSNGHIKIDPQTKTLEKTWGEFVSEFKSIRNSKIINNGEVLTEKNNEDSLSFVINCFKKYGKRIENREAKLLMSIVGYDRGMLLSDIQKLCLTSPEVVDARFILDNAFPTTKESVLYKLGNVIDEGTIENIIYMTDRFLSSGIDANELAVIIVRKARWQLIATYYWCSGLNWESIPNAIMDMGKFPSFIWHSDQMNPSQKRQESEPLQDPEKMKNFLCHKMGIPDIYFKTVEKKETKSKGMSRKNAEVMPMYFMAEQTVRCVEKIANNNDMPEDALKKKMLDRALSVYSFVLDKMCEIRYGSNPEQDLHEMIKRIADRRL